MVCLMMISLFCLSRTSVIKMLDFLDWASDSLVFFPPTFHHLVFLFYFLGYFLHFTFHPRNMFIVPTIFYLPGALFNPLNLLFFNSSSWVGAIIFITLKILIRVFLKHIFFLQNLCFFKLFFFVRSSWSLGFILQVILRCLIIFGCLLKFKAGL